MCMGKVDVCCPKCNTRLHVTRPDSEHPFWSLEKPRKDEGISKVVEQLLECTNPTCSSKFTVYWYNEQRPQNEVRRVSYSPSLPLGMAIIWNVCEVKITKTTITFWDIPALKYGFYSILMCLGCRERNEDLGEGFPYPKGFF